MDKISILFAKLAGLHKTVTSRLTEKNSHGQTPRTFDPLSVIEDFEKFAKLSQELKSLLPDLYSDLPDRELPKPLQSEIYNNRGYIQPTTLTALARDLEYIFEVWANSKSNQDAEPTCRIFISHGRSPDWYKVQAYIEKDAQIETLKLAQEANRGRTVLQKLNEEANRCSYAVIVMTGDDEIGEGERPRARENVMHEIGFFQGKYGLHNVCLLYEEGTNIPSNIHGLAYIPFPKGYIDATFGALLRELNAAFSNRTWHYNYLELTSLSFLTGGKRNG